jgi:hypothetical protein
MVRLYAHVHVHVHMHVHDVCVLLLVEEILDDWSGRDDNMMVSLIINESFDVLNWIGNE